MLFLRGCAAALLVLVAAAVWLHDDLRDLTVDDTRFAKEIQTAAHRHGLDPQLVRAVVFQESRFDPFAHGRSGEIGLMQVHPSGAAAEWARVNKRDVPEVSELYDPEVNLEIGCWYLASGVRKYAEYARAIDLALARYNAGESRSEKWKPERKDGDVIGRITIAGTKNYVMKILERYRRYQEEARKRAH